MFAEPYTFVINRDKFRTAYKLLRIEKVEIFARLRAAYVVFKKKVQFSSECKLRVFANCSKNQNKVLKCIFKSSWVLGFAKYWGLCKKKIPHGWGNTRTLKCTISKVPTSTRGSPPPRGSP